MIRAIATTLHWYRQLSATIYACICAVHDRNSACLPDECTTRAGAERRAGAKDAQRRGRDKMRVVAEEICAHGASAFRIRGDDHLERATT